MKIFLNFIFKNESPVLSRMLNSLISIVDGVICVDTGSTDSSKEIIRDIFEKAGKPCEIYDHPFIDFEDARNFALYKLKESQLVNQETDFSLWGDCDEEILIKDGFDINKFKSELSKHDAGISNVNYGIRYGRQNFFRIAKPFHWTGKVHELLMCSNEPIKSYFINDIEVLVHTDGHSWSNQKEKYLSHARILEKEVAERNDPRSVFYLAQSYRDALENEKAIEWYGKRAAMTTGFFEERYVSQLQIGKLKWLLSYPVSEVADEFMKCGELDTLRAEHLYELKIMYERNGRQQAAINTEKLLYGYYGKNPYPQRVLFLNEEAYKVKPAEDLTAEEIYYELCYKKSDINEHLPTLKRYAEKCEHVTEFGFRHGCSIFALLMAKPKRLVSYDLNNHPTVETVKKLARKENVNFQFKQENVLNANIEETDFLFIDTWHCDHQLKKELELHAGKVKKFLGFHDTFSFWLTGEDGGIGLKPVIESFLLENTNWKEDFRTDDNNGLLILKNGN